MSKTIITDKDTRPATITLYIPIGTVSNMRFNGE